MVQKISNKIKVAFVIPPNTNWLGEINYFRSLLSSINEINKVINTEFYVFISKFDKNFSQKKFKNIRIIQTNILNKNGILPILKKIFSFIFNGHDPFIKYLLKKKKIEILSHYKPIKGFKNISWFPDFQHIYFPNFFSKKEIISRNNLYKYYLKNSKRFIVSSNSAKKDLINFKKDNKRIDVLKFIPEINFKNIKNRKYLKNEIDVNTKYIFTPNQFWLHKNHISIIEALKILKERNLNFVCIFTGSNFDHRKPKYFSELMDKIKLYNLKTNVKYLGVLPYKKILNLLYHSEIVINPSFFEGWSTVVEEAKIFDKKILLSNINVHLEQNPDNGIFFNPNDSKDLANKIEKFFFLKKKTKNINVLEKKYKLKRKNFAKKYISIINKIKIK